MSLINQMLHDLERRRVIEGVDVHDASFDPGFYNSRQNNYNVRNIVLIIGLSSLFALSGILIYKNYSAMTAMNHSLSQVPAVNHQPRIAKTVSPAKVKPAQPAKVTRIKPAITAKTVATPMPVAKKVTKPEHGIPQLAFTENQTEEPVIEEDAYVNTDAVDDIRPVHKQSRPLSPTQRAELAYRKGYALINRQQLYAGETQLRLALVRNAKHIKAREMLVGLYLKSGRRVEANTLLSQGTVQLPAYSNFTKLHARLLLDQGDIKQAVNLLRQHQPGMLDDPNYFALLAAAYQRDKNHIEAAAIYVKLLKIRPRQGMWWVALGISLEALGKTDRARDAYEKARQTGTLNGKLTHYSDARLFRLGDTETESSDF